MFAIRVFSVAVRITTAALLLTAAMLVFATGIAQAGTVTSALTFVGGPEVNTVRVSTPSPGFGSLVEDIVYTDSTSPITVSAEAADQGCVNDGPNTVHCGDDEHYALNPGCWTWTTPTIVVSLGGGNDSFGVSYTYTDGNGDLQTGSTSCAGVEVHGGDGNDEIETISHYAGTTIDAGAGDDTVHVDTCNDTIDLGPGDDYTVQDLPFSGSYCQGFATYYGGDGNDEIHAGGGNDTLYGGDGNDELYGEYDDDTMYGGMGADVISGGVGKGYAEEEHDVVRYDEGTDCHGTCRTAVAVTASLDGVRNDGSIEDSNNDYIMGDVEDLVGGTGDDTLTGNGGDNQFWGDAGDDTLQGGGGPDDLHGEGGVDTADYSTHLDSIVVSLASADYAEGGASDEADLLADGQGDRRDFIDDVENVVGGAAGDELVGTAGANTLDGGVDSSSLSVDLLSGGGGDDRLISREGRDHLQGGDGRDIGDYRGRETGVALDIATQAGDDGRDEDGDGTVDDGFEGLIETDVEDLQGGDGDDTLVAGEGDNLLIGGAGADTFVGGAGTDTVSYGDLRDTYHQNQAHAVTVSIGQGSQDDGAPGEGDTVLSDIENLVGTIHADTLVGDADDNVLQGGYNGDSITGGGGEDTADYSERTADQPVRVVLGSFATNQGGGDGIEGDHIATDVESVCGGAGDDALTGDDGDNRLAGMAGDDALHGGDGVDTVDYSALQGRVGAVLGSSADQYGVATESEDVAPYAQYTDRLYGDLENIIGTDSYDSLSGNGSDNVLLGGAGPDTMLGFGGDDLLDGGTDADGMAGGSGFDTVDYSAREDAITVTVGDDTYGNGDGNELDGSEYNQGAHDNVASDVERVLGTSGDDSFTGYETLSQWEQAGDETFVGGGGADQFDGKGGTDTVDYSDHAAGVEVDLAAGTGGNDADGAGDSLVRIERVVGSEHDDVLVGGSGADTFVPGAGADAVTGDGALDTVSYEDHGGAVVATIGDQDGNSGNASDGTVGQRDTIGADIEILVGGSGADTLYGDITDNTLDGGAGEDALHGGAGDDTIDGGAGNDELLGEAGEDTLLENLGHDTLDGGDDDDTLHAHDAEYDHEQAGDTFIGGAGDDTVTYAGRVGNLVIDQADGLAHDGLPAFDDEFDVWDRPEEGDDVGADVETIIGGDSADMITGGPGRQTIEGGDGDDVLEGGSGPDELIGGAGSDAVSYADHLLGVVAELSTEDVLVTSSGNASDEDVVDAVVRRDAIHHDVEQLTGTDAGDELRGTDTGDGYGAVTQVLRGAGGDDLLDGRGGADEMLGGMGVDTVSYADRTAEVAVSLDPEQPHPYLQGVMEFPANDGEFFEDDRVGDDVENAITGAGPDQVVGSDEANHLDPGTGQDNVIGMGGSDVIDARDGAGDTVACDAANGANDPGTTDVVDADGGDTTDAACESVDRHGEGNTGGGQDSDQAGDGVVTLAYGSVNYAAAAGQSNVVTLIATHTTVTLRDTGVTSLEAGEGCVAVQGDAQAVVCTTSSPGGNDEDTYWSAFVTTADHDDSIRVLGATGAVLSLNATAGSGADVVEGGTSGDWLDGGSGDDVLRGFGGSDNLTGGPGADTIDGGAGVASEWDRGDIADYHDHAAAVVVDLAGATGDDGSDGEGDTLIAIESVQGGAGSDTLTGSSGANNLWGGPGGDTLRGGDGADVLSGDLHLAPTSSGDNDDSNDDLDGEGGNDVLVGSAGADDLLGGAGVDTVTYEDHAPGWGETLDSTFDVTADLDGVADDGSSSDEAVIDTVTRRDRIAEVENLTGGPGNDTLTGDSQNNRLLGGAGYYVSDPITFEYSRTTGGNDTLSGGAGNDTISGSVEYSATESDGTDHVDGGPGNDTIDVSDTAADDGTCGDGTDTAYLDNGIDALTACERINPDGSFSPGLEFSFLGDELPHVTEGASTTYAVNLAMAPTATVVVTLQGDAQVAVSPSTLTFTTQNWSVPQTVTVTGIDDSTVEGDHTGVVTHAISSSDPDWTGLESPTVTTAVTDNDTPIIDVLVAQSGSGTQVTEGGATDTYTLRLASAPTSTVTVTAVPATGLVVSPTSVTFTTSNWATPQTVTVSAINDDVAHASRVLNVTHTTASSDTRYDGIAVTHVATTVLDDDVARLSVTAASGTTVAEAGATSITASVRLTSQPTANVTVTATGTQVTAAPSTLTFTASNWNQAQSVTVTAIDDLVDEASPHAGVLALAASSSDTLYSGLTASQAVSVTDDDTAAVVADAGDGVHVAEPSGTDAPNSDTFTIRLASQPTGTVTVLLEPNAQVTVSPTTLTFNAGTWTTPQTVTVRAVADRVAADGRIIATASGAGSTYNGPFTHVAVEIDTAAEDRTTTQLPVTEEPRQANLGNVDDVDADDAVSTLIQIPSGIGDRVEIDRSAGGSTTEAPSGIQTMLPLQLQIEVLDADGDPIQTTTDAPLALTITIDGSLFTPEQRDRLRIIRDGVVIASCTTPGVLAPNPCMSTRTVLPSGDVKIVVLTTHASTWNVGVAAPVVVPPADTGGGSTGGGSTGGGSTGGTTDTPKDTTAPTLKVAKLAKLVMSKFLKSGIAFKATCNEACTINVQLKIDAKLAKKLKLSPVVGTATVAGTANKAATVTVKLSAKAKKALAKQKGLKLTAVFTVTDTSANKRTLNQPVTVAK